MNASLSSMPNSQQTSPTSIMAISGWVCDRYTDRGMMGSGLLARRAATRLKAPLIEIGEPEHASDLGWRDSLDKATPFLKTVASHLDHVLTQGQRPMIFANRCGGSIATIATVLRHHPDACVVWCDAHGDFNTPESTETGYLGGMVLTALCGMWDSGFGAGLTPDRIVLVGARDIDPAEKALLDQYKVKTIVTTSAHFDVKEVISAINGRPVWLHVDTDILDPSYVPAEYQVPNGLHPAALRELIESISKTSEIIGYEMTEFEAPKDLNMQEYAIGAIMTAIEPVLSLFKMKA